MKTSFRSLLTVATAAALITPTPTWGGDALMQLLKVLKDRGSISETEYQGIVEAAKNEQSKPAVAPPPVATPPAPSVAVGSSPTPKPGPEATAATEAMAKALKGKWYEKISLRGYAQLRYSYQLDDSGAPANVPNDSSVGTTSSFMLRRARLILSGDATEKLFLYAQTDFNASLSSGEYTLGMRDYYGDIAFDDKKEFRLRVGQSKVPYGWVNLQSSQNRAPMERADALNGAVEGERDIGAFFYWAPADVRSMYRDLVKLGLKGSGDYGVFAMGAYSGQGLNRLDLNGEPHVVARLNRPWKLANGQYVEVGIQAYHGKFVSAVSQINLGSGAFTPTRSGDGVVDQRAGASFIWYPQPIGVEAEWNIGRGPELNPTTRAIESQNLHGGYVQLSYRIEKQHGDWYPFARWQYYQGGRKFAANAPGGRVNELDFGIEWQPMPEVELSLMYTRTFKRTNTRVAPYADTTDGNRIAVQAQINY